ncbi:sensor domain-containing protein [Xylanibacillus composti]|nr:sensor domain-containing protein [Xylanibacillus composti]
MIEGERAAALPLAKGEIRMNPSGTVYRSTSFSPGFLGVLLHAPSYWNALYALLAMPLGIVYFVFITTGLTLSAGLVPLFLLGLPLFLGVAAGAGGIAAFEANIAGRMLGEPKFYPPAISLEGSSFFDRVRRVLVNPVTYKSFFFLLLKLPLGLFLFVLAVLAFSGFATLLAPIVWVVLKQTIQVDIYEEQYLFLSWFGIEASPLLPMLLNIGIGLLLSAVSLHMVNLLSVIQARLALWAVSQEGDES